MPDAPFAQGDPDNPIALYESLIRQDLPAAYYRFEVAAPLADSSENTNTLSAVGSPDDFAGLIYTGRSRDFDGTNDAYTAADHASLDVGDSFTLECWVTLDALVSQTFIGKGATAYSLRYSGSQSQFTLYRGNDSQTLLARTTGIAIATGTVYHVVATKDGANGAKIYVNGIDRTGTTNAGTCTNNATALSLGQDADANDERLNGRLDEVAIYPYPLTPSMVRAHYEAGVDGSFGIRGLAWFPGAKVEVAYDSPAFAAYPLWVDVTEAIRDGGGLRVEGSGRANETQQSQPGSAALIFGNRDGAIWDSTTKPMRAVRARCGWGTDPENFAPALYHLFRGWIPSWRPQYPNFGLDATVEIACVDGFAVLEQAQTPEGTEFAAELAGSRIEACLTLAGIPSSQWNIDTGFVTMPALDDFSGSLLEHIRAVAESDGGFFYIGPDGRFTYEDRTYRALQQQTPLATFGDGGEAFPDELPYRDIEPSGDTDFLFNDARFTSGDGTGTGAAEDASSIAEYGRHTYPPKTLLTGFNECQAAAEWVVGRYKDHAVRFVAVEFKGAHSPTALWHLLLSAWNSNRYEFVNRPLGGGTETQEEFIERASHLISMADWSTTWVVSPHGDEDIWFLDDPAFVLGTNTTPTW